MNKEFFLRLVLGKRSQTINNLFAVIVAVLSLVVAHSVGPRSEVPYYFLPFLAVLFAALVGGTRSGIIASLIGAIGLDLFIIDAGKLFNDPQDYLRILFYLISAGAAGVVVDELRDAYRTSEKFRRVAEREVDAREKVIGIVAHDLRNPLTNLSIKVHMLRRGAMREQSIEKQTKMIDSMWFSIERMNRIIEDLLDATQICAGNFTLEVSRCSVGYLVKEILDSLQEMGTKRSVALSSAIDDGTQEMACDPYRIAQVLGNLLQNAIKHSPSNGLVSISTHTTSSGITFAITDEGAGVSAKLGDDIFEAYTTGEDSDSQPGAAGAGLGLYISRAIVRCHGGDLTYRNRPEGGAEFTFFLPHPKMQPIDIQAGSHRATTQPVFEDQIAVG